MLFSNQKHNWIAYGTITEVKRVSINGHEYLIEVAAFKSYQEALSKTFQVVNKVADHAELLEKKGDLYDWTSTIMRFAETTMEVRNIRPEHKIIVVQSVHPISIAEFEKDNAVFNYTQ